MEYVFCHLKRLFRRNFNFIPRLHPIATFVSMGKGRPGQKRGYISSLCGNCISETTSVLTVPQ